MTATFSSIACAPTARSRRMSRSADRRSPEFELHLRCAFGGDGRSLLFRHIDGSLLFVAAVGNGANVGWRAGLARPGESRVELRNRSPRQAATRPTIRPMWSPNGSLPADGARRLRAARQEGRVLGQRRRRRRRCDGARGSALGAFDRTGGGHARVRAARPRRATGASGSPAIRSITASRWSRAPPSRSSASAPSEATG